MPGHFLDGKWVLDVLADIGVVFLGGAFLRTVWGAAGRLFRSVKLQKQAEDQLGEIRKLVRLFRNQAYGLVQLPFGMDRGRGESALSEKVVQETVKKAAADVQPFENGRLAPVCVDPVICFVGKQKAVPLLEVLDPVGGFLDEDAGFYIAQHVSQTSAPLNGIIWVRLDDTGLADMEKGVFRLVVFKKGFLEDHGVHL